MFNLLMENTQVKDLLVTEDKEDMFLNLLFRYSQIALSNFCPMNALERINDEGKSEFKRIVIKVS
jgi:hypothetical protein